MNYVNAAFLLHYELCKCCIPTAGARARLRAGCWRAPAGADTSTRSGGTRRPSRGGSWVYIIIYYDVVKYIQSTLRIVSINKQWPPKSKLGVGVCISLAGDEDTGH